jgi:hypothetical protein
MSKDHINPKKPIAAGILRNLINPNHDNVIRRHKKRANEEEKRAKEIEKRANEIENKRLLKLYADENFRPMTPLSSPLSPLSQFVPYSTIPSPAGGKRRGKHSKKHRKHRKHGKSHKRSKKHSKKHGKKHGKHTRKH